MSTFAIEADHQFSALSVGSAAVADIQRSGSNATIYELKALFTFASVFVVGILMGLVVASNDVHVPSRPANFPIGASWQGGNDGGNWFRYVDQSLNRYRCQVYADVTGRLLIDDLFKPTEKGINGKVNLRLFLSDNEI